MSEHTQTPWEFDGNCGGYITESGDRIARAYARGDAKFIVRAVNSHADMLAALKACVISYGDENPDDDWTAIRKARAAIAKAEGH